MSRFPRYVVWLVALAALAVSPVLAQDVVQKKAEGSAQPGQPQVPYVPGYWQLSQPNIQKEIELSDAQLEQLKALGKKYAEAQREDYKGYGDWSKMTQEERTAKYKEITDRMKKRTDDVRAEIEKVLLPHQIKALRDIAFRTYSQYMIYQPRILEAVGVTEAQKAQLQKLRDEFTEKTKQLQKEMTEKQLEVFTPEQREKLKEQVLKMGY